MLREIYYQLPATYRCRWSLYCLCMSIQSIETDLTLRVLPAPNSNESIIKWLNFRKENQYFSGDEKRKNPFGDKFCKFVYFMKKIIASFTNNSWRFLLVLLVLFLSKTAVSTWKSGYVYVRHDYRWHYTPMWFRWYFDVVRSLSHVNILIHIHAVEYKEWIFCIRMMKLCINKD